MTAKEQLREHVEALSEDDAAKVLRVLSKQLGDGDPLLAHPDVVPLSEESFSPADQALIREGREDIEAGRTVSLEELQAKYG